MGYFLIQVINWGFFELRQKIFQRFEDYNCNLIRVSWRCFIRQFCFEFRGEGVLFILGFLFLSYLFMWQVLQSVLVEFQNYLMMFFLEDRWELLEENSAVGLFISQSFGSFWFGFLEYFFFRLFLQLLFRFCVEVGFGQVDGVLDFFLGRVNIYKKIKVFNVVSIRNELGVMGFSFFLFVRFFKFICLVFFVFFIIVIMCNRFNK